jgi:hypothetical protein
VGSPPSRDGNGAAIVLGTSAHCTGCGNTVTGQNGKGDEFLLEEGHGQGDGALMGTTLSPVQLSNQSIRQLSL